MNTLDNMKRHMEIMTKRTTLKLRKTAHLQYSKNEWIVHKVGGIEKVFSKLEHDSGFHIRTVCGP